MSRTASGWLALALAACAALALIAPAGAAARLGDPDPAFDGDGLAAPAVGAPAAALKGIAVRPDGRSVAVGYAQSSGAADVQGLVIALTSGGRLDNDFNGDGVRLLGTANELHAVALTGDGRVLAAGRGPSFFGSHEPIVARLTASGALDPSFGADGIAHFDPTGEARAVAALPDGRVLIAGQVQIGPTAPERFFVARLTAAGTPDVSFGDGHDGATVIDFGSVHANADAMAVAPDGSIVLAGHAGTGPGGAPEPALARLTPDGELDGTFDDPADDQPAGRVTVPVSNPDGDVSGTFKGVQARPDGRILAVGASGGYGLLAGRLASGRPDAAVGTTYPRVGDPTAIRAIGTDADGRPVVAGRTVSGTRSALIGFLDADGRPDSAAGSAPPGWRVIIPPGDLGAASSAIATGPAGLIYTAGRRIDASEDVQPLVTRQLGNAAPSARLSGPTRVTARGTATFDAGGSSDAEGQPLRFDFELVGFGTIGSTGAVAAISFPTPGRFTVRVRVTDHRGASAIAEQPVEVLPAAGPSPAQQPPAPAPPPPAPPAEPAPEPEPELGRTGAAEPERGSVRVRLPGARHFDALTDLRDIPNGTEIDARKGRVRIFVERDGSGAEDSAIFYAGRFRFRQGRGRAPVTTLTLSGGSFRHCSTRRGGRALASLSAAARQRGAKRKVRRLWGDGKGRFRTRGRYGAATVRGTRWLTEDRCDGTSVRVSRGVVAVADLRNRQRRQIVVRAGRRTLIPARRP